ncbi:hypothetical protein [uncultured Cetobacterium sp.]|uniref:hypothetical protein n=1 Tax=uncultured Cetobacterium sp. TaxID=527638 RepID=UPI002621F5E0|nr:hypothetical protein [uncultured Cetobacterium sp.]
MFETTEVKVEKVELDAENNIDNNVLLVGMADKDKQDVLDNFSIGIPMYYGLLDNQQSIDKECGKDYIVNGDKIIFINPLGTKKVFEGRVEPLKKAIKSSEAFLKSMIKYNNTLRDFTKVLEKGKFEILDQYSPKDIRHYILGEFNNYTTKGEKYVGHMDTKSKMDFFPTNFEFQYASLLEVFSVGIKKGLIKKGTSNFIYKNFRFVKDLEEIKTDKLKWLYRGLIRMGRFDIIDEIFILRTQTLHSDRIVVADLFAGEGEWLNLYKKLGSYYDIFTVANEIEENRFEKIREKKFNEMTNKAYEELVEIPKKLIDVCLFNPPYGASNGENNVNKFLNMMIEDDYLNDDAKVIFAIREDDTMAILEDIFKNFMIKTDTIFRHDGNEYDKLKQICFVGVKRYSPINHLGRLDRIEFDDVKDKIKKLSKRSFEELALWKIKQDSYPAPVYGSDVSLKYDNLKIENNPDMYLSDNDSVWSKIQSALSIETFSGKTVKLPNEPRTFGAIANLIASGLINGEIEGENPHCLAAGVKESITQVINEDGDLIVTKKMLPFCSILSEDGKIIEVASGTEESTVDVRDDGLVVEL